MGINPTSYGAIIMIGGIVIGYVLSSFGIFLNHWFSLRKEEKRWIRQEKIENRRLREIN